MFSDVVHCAALQLEDPTTSIAFDADSAQAIRTRQRILAQLASSGARVAGCHLDGFGRIQPAGQGYAFRAAS
jgi:hypothetical protein